VSDGQAAPSLKPRWYLERVEVLRAATAAEMAEVLSWSTVRTYARGQVIFAPGDRVTALHVIQTGRITIYGLTKAGRKVTYLRAYPGEAFGLAELLTAARRECFAEADIASTALEVPRPAFKRLLQHNTEVAFHVIEALGARLRQEMESVRRMTGDMVEERVVAHLLKLGEQAGRNTQRGAVRVNERHTHQDIADAVGATRQTVSEILGRLRAGGLLGLEGGHLVLLKIDELRQLVE
jgi:CRP/FNR family cyclic AMP-dependent transcriptional regulator